MKKEKREDKPYNFPWQQKVTVCPGHISCPHLILIKQHLAAEETERIPAQVAGEG